MTWVSKPDFSAFTFAIVLLLCFHTAQVRGMWREQKLGGKVEAFVFSYGPDDGSVYRKSIAKEVENFRDMHGKTFREIGGLLNPKLYNRNSTP